MFNCENRNICAENITVGDVPCIRFYPSKSSGFKAPFATLLYYHGWSSQKENQTLIAHLFASLGFQVLVPDAIHHGERGKFNDYDKAFCRNLFLTIMQNLAEFPLLLNHLTEQCGADKNAVAVAGNSMGGFTAAGIFTHNSAVKTAIVFNGACDWENSVLYMEKKGKTQPLYRSAAVKKANPAYNMEKIINRPLLLMHGTKDAFVPYAVQKQFYKKASALYKNPDKIVFIGVERMNHYISVQMLSHAASWLEKELKGKDVFYGTKRY